MYWLKNGICCIKSYSNDLRKARKYVLFTNNVFDASMLMWYFKQLIVYYYKVK